MRGWLRVNSTSRRGTRLSSLLGHPHEWLATAVSGGTHSAVLPSEQCCTVCALRVLRVPTLAVCLSREHLARTTRWLPDETLIAIASENNLSETAFVVSYGKPYPYPYAAVS